MPTLTPESVERLVLSGLSTPVAVTHAQRAGLTDASFVALELHATVWRYITTFVQDRGECPGHGDLRALGFEPVPDVQDYERYVDELVQSDVQRQLRLVLYRQLKELEDEGGDPRAKLRAIVDGLQNISYGSQVRLVYFDRDAPERLSRVTERVEAKRQGLVIGVSTGLRSLDENGGEWQKGDLVAIIGPPTAGKSTLLIHFAVTAWAAGYRVLFISPENIADDIHLRADPMAAQFQGRILSNHALRTGKDVDMDTYRDHIESIKDSDRWATTDRGEAGFFTVADIQRALTEFRPDVLCVDGAHLITGPGQTWENMFALGKMLKATAQDRGIVVLVGTQATKNTLAAGAELPEMNDAAYGKAIMEDSNRVISMGRDRGGLKRRSFKVIKWRDGPTDEKKRYLTFDVDAGVVCEQAMTAERPDGMVDVATFT